MFQVEGIITALLTPFKKGGGVDEKALRGLVNFQIEKGVDGLYPCGTAGSGAIMKVEDRKVVTEIVFEECSGRIPLIIHVGAANTDMAVELAKHSERIGADAIACVTPYYYAVDEEALCEHYLQVCSSVSLPVFLYNIPRNTNVNMSAAFVEKMSKNMRNVVGIKDSSRDFNHLLSYLEKLPEDFIVINGTDTYAFPAFIMGSKGQISGIPNAYPEVYVELYKAFKEGRYDDACKIQLRINSLRSALSQPLIAPLHEALKMRGMESGTVMKPLRPVSEKERNLVQSRLEALGFPIQ